MDITPLIQLVLTLLQQILPQLGGANAGLIAKIITGLEVLIPVLIKEYQDVVPMVRNVISVLKNNNQVTPEQWATLDQMETKIDADFEAAAARAQAEDSQG